MSTIFELRDFFEAKNIVDKIPVVMLKMNSTANSSPVFVKIHGNKHYNTCKMACYCFYKNIY